MEGKGDEVEVRVVVRRCFVPLRLPASSGVGSLAIPISNCKIVMAFDDLKDPSSAISLPDLDLASES